MLTVLKDFLRARCYATERHSKQLLLTADARRSYLDLVPNIEVVS